MDLSKLWATVGPAVAGAVLPAGCWFWGEAIVCSSIKVSFLHYLPGIFASLAALMFNCVRREDIDYSPYKAGEMEILDLKHGEAVLVCLNIDQIVEESGTRISYYRLIFDPDSPRGKIMVVTIPFPVVPFE